MIKRQKTVTNLTCQINEAFEELISDGKYFTNRFTDDDGWEIEFSVYFLDKYDEVNSGAVLSVDSSGIAVRKDEKDFLIDFHDLLSVRDKAFIVDLIEEEEFDEVDFTEERFKSISKEASSLLAVSLSNAKHEPVLNDMLEYEPIFTYSIVDDDGIICNLFVIGINENGLLCSGSYNGLDYKKIAFSADDLNEEFALSVEEKISLCVFLKNHTEQKS